MKHVKLLIFLNFPFCVKDFEKDFSRFQERVEDFDRQLSSILCLAFQDCSGLESVFKVSNSGETDLVQMNRKKHTVPCKSIPFFTFYCIQNRSCLKQFNTWLQHNKIRKKWILSQGTVKYPNLYNIWSLCLKLVAVLKPLLERDIIKEMFIPNFSKVIQLFADDLDRCKHLFDSHLELVK